MSDHVQNCHVDYLAFTIRGFQGVDIEDQRDYALSFLRDLCGDLPVDISPRGWRGYDYSIKVHGGGMIAFGGETNNHTMHYDLPGDMCALVVSWSNVADMLDDERVKLTRVDIAHDDFSGETVSIDWARAQYDVGGYKPSRGLSPRSRLFSDEGSGHGSTYYVGSRESGKMLRIYEKGKQLGDPNSNWNRVECEWRAVHRTLDVDMLRDPSSYLAAAYPCLSFISGRSSFVATVAFKAMACLEKAGDHAEKQAGGYLRALVELGYTLEQAALKVIKREVSPRLQAIVRIIKSDKSAQPDRKPSWWSPPDDASAARLAAYEALDFAYWRRCLKDFVIDANEARRQTVTSWAYTYQG